MAKKTDRLTIPFRELHIEDVPLVGGKNAALGELFQVLVRKGINVPDGYAITAHAYREFVTHNAIDKKIAQEGIQEKAKSRILDCKS